MKYKGTGAVVSTDFKSIEWTGKTQAGNAVKITFEKAINLGNIDWTFADKDEVVPEIVFTAVYSNTNGNSADTTEPWEVDFGTLETNASGNIILDSGVLSVGGNVIALSRGGGSFKVERTFKEIEADGDRGPVEGRIRMTGSRATLTMKVLTIVNSFADVYPAVAVTQ